MPKHFLILSLLITILISCKQDSRHIVVYTDVPEAELLFNQFNTTQSEYTVETVLKGSQQEISLNELDMILARDIHSAHYMGLMENLNTYREKDFIQGVYPEILLSCIQNTELKLIPLSLGLPLATGREFSENSKYIDWHSLSEQAADLNKLKNDQLTRTGFSPLWSRDFIIAYLTYGSDATLALLENRNELYEKKTSELQEWMELNNNGSDGIQHFMDKYMYIPDYRLLGNGRIGFSIMKLSEYMLLTDSITHNLSFKLFTISGRLQPTQIISAGIPVEAPNSEGAKKLLEWLMEEETWKSYILTIVRNRDKIFGLEGLCANYTINESLFTEAYPILKEHIPYPGEFGQIPVPVPQCKKIREELLIPHTLKVLRGEEEAADLSEEYRKWLLLNPDPLLTP